MANLELNLAAYRNAASQAFLLNNERDLNLHFKITKSPSFITSQEHYHGLNPRQKHLHSSNDSRRNKSLEERCLGEWQTTSQLAGMSPSRGHRSQLLICKNQLSAKSKANHQKIKERMLAQKQRHQSQ